MSTTITRLFPTEQQATDAVAKLKKVGIVPEVINVVTPAAGDVAAVQAAVEKGGVPPSHARVYAAKIAAGASSVTVVAGPYKSLPSIKILESFQPIDSGIAEPDLYESADVSDIPKVIAGDSTVQLLKSDAYFSNWIGMPLLLDSNKQPSGLLTNSQPFSKATAGGPTLPFPTIIKDKNG